MKMDSIGSDRSIPRGVRTRSGQQMPLPTVDDDVSKPGL
jgi:hypothetical protein